MILKSYEIDKINFDNQKLFLFYGKNEGFKYECIKRITNNRVKSVSYDEKEILENSVSILDSLFNNSLFENEKIIIIKRATDKILKIVEEINQKNIENTIIIINASNLEKKSKLRSYFEKSKDQVCIAFYPDNDQTLSKIAYNFCKEKKIAISQSDINQLISKTNGDRHNLITELEKIENFVKNGKKLNSENLLKLINLYENHSISELINNCLAKNKKNTIKILNENNYTNEDCILISRTFLSQSKKILKLSTEYSKNKNIDLTISLARPPIFWKDKEITKKQIHEWKPENLRKLIHELNEIELQIKKNLNNSIYLISNFILEKSISKSNN